MNILRVTLLICLVNPFTFGQNLKIQLTGFVYDNKSFERIPEAIIYTNYELLGKSDSTGFFRISTSESVLHFSVKALGYKVSKITMEIEPDDDNEIVIYLIPDPIELESVTISGERYTENYSNTYELLNGDIKNIPALAESDGLRVIHTLPGVVSSSDFNSQVFMRGGNFDETAISLDGIPLYNAYHVGGLFSAFNSDIVQKEKIYSSNYPIHFDDFLSGVIDIDTKSGNRERIKGIASLGLISSKLFLEGPLLGGSFIFSARRTYLDLIGGLFNSKYDFPYYFYDFYGKYSIAMGSNHLLNISGFYSKDIFNGYYDFENIPEEEILNWKNIAGKVDYTYLISNKSNLRINFNFSGSFQNSNTSSIHKYYPEIVEKLYLDNSFTNVVLNAEYNHKGQGWESKTGIKLNSFSTNYNWDISGIKLKIDLSMKAEDILFDYAPKKYNGKNEMQSVKLYSVNQINISTKLKTIVGLGVTSFMGFKTIFVNPFIELKYWLIPDVNLKFSFGKYFQPVYTKRDRVNISFLNPFSVYFLGESKNEIPLSDHFCAGVSFLELPYNLSLEIEGYYKTRKNIPTAIDINQQIEFYDGYALGLDILLKKESDDFNGWFTYSYSRSVKSNNEYRFFAGYDRSHSVKIITSYSLSNNWNLNVFWTYVSGLPFTPAVGKSQGLNDYSEAQEHSGNKNEFYMYRSWRIMYGRQNSERFKGSHRLDIGITGKFIWWGKIVVKPYLQVMNVYNNANPFQYRPDANNLNVEDGEARGSYVLPTVGLVVEF